MGEELEVIDAEEVVPDERKQTGLWKHPNRQAIEHLIRAGRSARWISLWLEDEYPDPEDVDDENFDDDEYEDPGYNAAQAERWRLREETIEAYRERWMPECQPGVDVINEDLYDFVERRLPAAAGMPWEIQVVEMGVDVAQTNLAKSLKNDESMKMLTPTTLDANDRMIAAATKSAELKGRLNVPGYEIAPERHQLDANVHTTNKSLNVELHGRVKPDGTIEPGEPAKLALARKMMDASPEERAEIIAAAKLLEPAEEIVDAEVSGDEPDT